MSELDLFRQVLVEDSIWLDDFQSSILKACTQQRRSVVDVTDSSSTSSEMLQENMTTVDSESNVDPLLPSSDSVDMAEVNRSLQTGQTRFLHGKILDVDCNQLDHLPAAEFVAGTRSCVATETYRLLKRSQSFPSALKLATSHLGRNVRLVTENDGPCDHAMRD
jgi:hypothetical protein